MSNYDDLELIARKAHDVYEANGLHFTSLDGPTCVEVLKMVAELRALRKLRDVVDDYIQHGDADAVIVMHEALCEIMKYKKQ